MWILLSIIAAFIWSIVNVIDKTIMTRFIKRPVIPVIISGLLGIVFSLIIWTKKFVLLSGWPLFLSLLAGAIAAVATIFYFKAIKIEEASRVVPLFAMTLIWIVVLAVIFLGEILTIQEYFGIFIIFLGSVLISIKKRFRFSLGKVFLLMLLSTILYAVNRILYKYLMGDWDYWTVFSWTNIGFFLIMFPLFIYYIPIFRETIKKYKGKAMGLIISSESLSLIALIIFLVAMSFGFVALVSAVNSVHYLFVFLWTILLSIWFPKIIKEELKGSIIFLKLLAIVLIIGGVVLVT